MSLANTKIVVSPTDGATLFPQWAYQATAESYEPGDIIGYGDTPEAAANDLFEMLSCYLDNVTMANPQQELS